MSDICLKMCTSKMNWAGTVRKSSSRRSKFSFAKLENFHVATRTSQSKRHFWNSIFLRKSQFPFTPVVLLQKLRRKIEENGFKIVLKDSMCWKQICESGNFFKQKVAMSLWKFVSQKRTELEKWETISSKRSKLPFVKDERVLKEVAPSST